MKTTAFRGMSAAVAVAGISLAFILLLVAVPASQGQVSDGQAGGDIPTGTSDSPQLLEKAEREGAVRVIARLQADFVPEGRLTRSQFAQQRNDIGSAQTELQAELQGTGYQTLREYETIPFIALELSAEALQAAQNSPRVISIVEDHAVPAVLAESAPTVQAPTMWASGFTGGGQVIAVLDTGVDGSHPFLAGKVVEEACFSGNGNCPNNATSQTGAGSGRPCTYAASGCRHGTHVAGIAAGQGTAFSGVARGAGVMAVQVFSRFTGADCSGAGEDPCTLSYSSDQIAGLERVLELKDTRNLSAANLSLGGGRFSSNCDAAFQAYKAVIDNLRSVGIATVIASGNNGFTSATSFPACISSAVSVGSTTKADTLSSFSNSASFLTLLAPGSSINSSVPGGGFAFFSGTSMAAPHVAGAWAILKQQNPSASFSVILSALRNTGTPVTDTRVAGGVTKPRINIADASEIVSSPCSTAPPNWVPGTNGPDRLVGTAGADVIRGLGGDDNLSGAGGDDCVTGDAGRDLLNGNDGNDELYGGAENDRISPGTGLDFVSMGSGNDRVDARDGQADTIDCGPDTDRVAIDAVDVLVSETACEQISRQ